MRTQRVDIINDFEGNGITIEGVLIKNGVIAGVSAGAIQKYPLQTINLVAATPFK